MVTFSSQLPRNTEVLSLFELQHPEALRWGPMVKLANYYESNSKYIWLWLDDEVIGEVILGWLDDEVINVDSITILPEYRGKQLGRALLGEAINWCKSKGFKKLNAAARQGASIKNFLHYGAIITDVKHNWGGCDETYIGVEIIL